MGIGSDVDFVMDVAGLVTGLDGQVVTIRFDRPDKRNAITYEMYVAMTQLLAIARDDDRVRCVVFTGTGRIFSAGHDVSGFARGLSIAPQDKPSYAFMEAVAAFPKPIIASVCGDAIGIGATLLLHCDFVYAASESRLVFPFIKMGLIPEFGSTVIMPTQIGYRKAMDLFLKDGECSAECAEQWGIVSRTMPYDELTPYTSEIAAHIAALSPEAVAETKRLMKMGSMPQVTGAIAEEAQIFHRLLQTEAVRDRLRPVDRSRAI